MQTTLKAFISRAYQMTCTALDKLLIGDWEWKWCGGGDTLFRREVELDGITYVGELSIDRTTVPVNLGTFGDEERPGALLCDDGRYFYPHKTEGILVAEMVARGMSGRQACREARRIIDGWFYWASSLGENWFFYTVKVYAKSNELPLAQVSLSGITAKLYGHSMDPKIDDIFYRLLKDAKEDAIKAMVQIKARKHATYTVTN